MQLCSLGRVVRWIAASMLVGYAPPATHGATVSIPAVTIHRGSVKTGDVNIHIGKHGAMIESQTDSGTKEIPLRGITINGDSGENITINGDSFDPDEPGFLGVDGHRIDESLQNALGITSGVFLEEVVSRSAAYRAGLRRGDVLVRLDGEDMNSMHDIGAFVRSHSPGDSVEVEFIRKGAHLKRTTVLGGRHTHRSGEDIVRIGHDITVAAGQHVTGDVVSIGGSVDVFGQVSGSVVSVGGGVNLHPTAIVEGDAVVVGGSVNSEPGAVVHGQNVSVGPGFALGNLLFEHNWSWIKFYAKLAKIVLFLVIFGVLYALFRERFLYTSYHASQHTVKAFLWGLLITATAPIVFLIMAVTIIGIPLALIYALTWFVAYIVGGLAAGLFLGKRLLNQGDDWSKGNLAAGLVGYAFLQSFSLVEICLQIIGNPVTNGLGFGIGMVGHVLGIMASLTGLGAIVLCKFSKPVNPAFFGLQGILGATPTMPTPDHPGPVPVPPSPSSAPQYTAPVPPSPPAPPAPPPAPPAPPEPPAGPVG